MNLLSSVNSFILTIDGADNPDAFLFFIQQSKGQGAFFWLVIIARTECSISVEKLPSFDRTSAGLLLERAESVKGKGTTTMSKGS